MLRVIAVGALLSLLAACTALPDKFSMYPDAATEDQQVDADKAVLLIGNAGPGSINYLQFDHSSLPAINVHGIDLSPGGIVAVPVPVGLKHVSLEDYTLSGRGAGYTAGGIGFGYLPVHSPAIDISARGLYYVATIRPDSSERYSIDPDPAALTQFRKTHPELASLKPVNFKWPG
jgi:hypothetical protein